MFFVFSYFFMAILWFFLGRISISLIIKKKIQVLDKFYVFLIQKFVCTYWLIISYLNWRALPPNSNTSHKSLHKNLANISGGHLFCNSSCGLAITPSPVPPDHPGRTDGRTKKVLNFIFPPPPSPRLFLKGLFNWEFPMNSYATKVTLRSI